MLAITLSLLVTIVALLWAYLNVTTRHMRKLAEKIPGPKQSPLWKKIFNRRTGSKGKTNLIANTDLLKLGVAQ
jgi:hypothetical protein